MPYLTEEERTSINASINTQLMAFSADLYSNGGTTLRSSDIPCVVSEYGVNSGVVQSSDEFVQRSEYLLTFPYGTTLKSVQYTIDTIVLEDGSVFQPISYEESAQAGIRIRSQCLFRGFQSMAPGSAPAPEGLFWMASPNLITEENRITGDTIATYSGTWSSSDTTGFNSVLYPNVVHSASQGSLSLVTLPSDPLYGSQFLDATFVGWVRLSEVPGAFDKCYVLYTCLFNSFDSSFWLCYQYDDPSETLSGFTLFGFRSTGSAYAIRYNISSSLVYDEWIGLAITHSYNTVADRLTLGGYINLNGTVYSFTNVSNPIHNYAANASSTPPFTVAQFNSVGDNFYMIGGGKVPSGYTSYKLQGAMQNLQFFSGVLSQSEIESAWYYNAYP